MSSRWGIFYLDFAYFNLMRVAVYVGAIQMDRTYDIYTRVPIKGDAKGGLESISDKEQTTKADIAIASTSKIQQEAVYSQSHKGINASSEGGAGDNCVGPIHYSMLLPLFEYIQAHPEGISHRDFCEPAQLSDINMYTVMGEIIHDLILPDEMIINQSITDGGLDSASLEEVLASPVDIDPPAQDCVDDGKLMDIEIENDDWEVPLRHRECERRNPSRANTVVARCSELNIKQSTVSELPDLSERH